MGSWLVTTNDLGFILLTGAVVVLAAIVAARMAHGIGLPGLLVFLGLGLAIGGGQAWACGSTTPGWPKCLALARW